MHINFKFFSVAYLFYTKSPASNIKQTNKNKVQKS